MTWACEPMVAGTGGPMWVHDGRRHIADNVGTAYASLIVAAPDMLRALKLVEQSTPSHKFIGHIREAIAKAECVALNHGHRQPMKTLDDTVMLDDVSPADVRDCLVDATNLAWKAHGEAARCSVPATFLGWLIQEHDRLQAAVSRDNREP